TRFGPVLLSGPKHGALIVGQLLLQVVAKRLVCTHNGPRSGTGGRALPHIALPPLLPGCGSRSCPTLGPAIERWSAWPNDVPHASGAGKSRCCGKSIKRGLPPAPTPGGSPFRSTHFGQSYDHRAM